MRGVGQIAAILMSERKNNGTGFPWPVWAGLLLLAISIFIATQLFPPTFSYSQPTVQIRGDIVIAEFDVTNRRSWPINKQLTVSIGTIKTGIKGSGPHYQPTDRQIISVSVAPSETKHIECRFPASLSVLPNAAEVTITQ